MVTMKRIYELAFFAANDEYYNELDRFECSDETTEDHARLTRAYMEMKEIERLLKAEKGEKP